MSAAEYDYRDDPASLGYDPCLMRRDDAEPGDWMRCACADCAGTRRDADAERQGHSL